MTPTQTQADLMRTALAEISGSKSLTATPEQFVRYLQRIATEALADANLPQLPASTEPAEKDQRTHYDFICGVGPQTAPAAHRYSTASEVDEIVREIARGMVDEIIEETGKPSGDGDEHGYSNYLTGKFSSISLMEMRILSRFAALAKPSTIASAENSQDQQKCIPPSRAEPASQRESPDEGVIRFKFFKMLSTAERMNVFRVFLDLPEKALEQVRDHSTEAKLLKSLLHGRFRAQGGNTKQWGAACKEIIDRCVAPDMYKNAMEMLERAIAAATPGDAAKED